MTGKVLAEYRDDSHEQHAGADANAEALSENELPKSVAQGNHHEAEYD